MDHRETMTTLGRENLLKMYSIMVEIRQFEETIRFLFLEGKMPGTIHQYIGMEACAVGVCSALAGHDIITSTHRPHGHAIAKGIPVKSLMAELFGKTTGCCGGKGGSMHIGDLERGMLPAVAIVGANIPITVGIALAFKMRKEKRVAISFFGDGASNEGAFHEGLNMAAVYQVPAVFVCENNLYAASTSIRKTARIEHIADRASAYGMTGVIADGMDVLDVYAKAQQLVSSARDESCPAILELKTFRLCGHSRRDPGNYIPQEEKEYWKNRDPISQFRERLLQEKYMNQAEDTDIAERVKEEIEQAVEYAKESPEPHPADTLNGLYHDMEVPE